ncbi:hypothetical protein BH11BAC4_BH11BAC4_22600 [soil metagenome]
MLHPINKPGTAVQYDPARLRPYSKKELCTFYGISQKVLAKWLKPFQEEIGDCNGRYFTIAQVRVILERLGTP